MICLSFYHQYSLSDAFVKVPIFRKNFREFSTFQRHAAFWVILLPNMKHFSPRQSSLTNHDLST